MSNVKSSPESVVVSDTLHTPLVRHVSVTSPLVSQDTIVLKDGDKTICSKQHTEYR